MGVLRMSRFRNSFIYGAFGKVGNFSYSSIGYMFQIPMRVQYAIAPSEPTN